MFDMTCERRKRHDAFRFASLNFTSSLAQAEEMNRL